MRRGVGKREKGCGSVFRGEGNGSELDARGGRGVEA